MRLTLGLYARSFLVATRDLVSTLITSANKILGRAGGLFRTVFDGTNQYVQLTGPITFRSDWKIRITFRTTNIVNQLLLGDSHVTSMYFNLSNVGNGNLNAFIGGVAYSFQVGALGLTPHDGEEHTVEYKLTGTTLSVKLDGTPIGTAQTIVPYTGVNNFRIGSSVSATNSNFNGSLTYLFIENNGETIVDMPLDESHLTLGQTIGAAFYKFGFGGTDDFLDFPDIELVIGDAVRFKFIAPTASGSWSNILDSSNDTDARLQVYRDSSSNMDWTGGDVTLDGVAAQKAVTPFPEDGLEHVVVLTLTSSRVMGRAGARATTGVNQYNEPIYDIEVLRKGVVATGPELYEFDGLIGWSTARAASTLSTDGEFVVATSTDKGTYGIAYEMSGLVVGRMYRLDVSVDRRTDLGNILLRLSTNSILTDTIVSIPTLIPSESHDRVAYFTATQETHYFGSVNTGPALGENHGIKINSFYESDLAPIHSYPVNDNSRFVRDIANTDTRLRYMLNGVNMGINIPDITVVSGDSISMKFIAQPSYTGQHSMFVGNPVGTNWVYIDGTSGLFKVGGAILVTVDGLAILNDATPPTSGEHTIVVTYNGANTLDSFGYSKGHGNFRVKFPIYDIALTLANAPDRFYEVKDNGSVVVDSLNPKTELWLSDTNLRGVNNGTCLTIIDGHAWDIQSISNGGENNVSHGGVVEDTLTTILEGNRYTFTIESDKPINLKVYDSAFNEIVTEFDSNTITFTAADSISRVYVSPRDTSVTRVSNASITQVTDGEIINHDQSNWHDGSLTDGLIVNYAEANWDLSKTRTVLQTETTVAHNKAVAKQQKRYYFGLDAVDDYLRVPTIHLLVNDLVSFKFLAPSVVDNTWYSILDATVATAERLNVYKRGDTGVLVFEKSNGVLDGVPIASNVVAFPSDGKEHRLGLTVSAVCDLGTIGARASNLVNNCDFPIYDIVVSRAGVKATGPELYEFNGLTGWNEPRSACTQSLDGEFIVGTADGTATYGMTWAVPNLTVGSILKVNLTLDRRDSGSVTIFARGDYSSGVDGSSGQHAYLNTEEGTEEINIPVTATTMYVGTIVAGHPSGTSHSVRLNSVQEYGLAPIHSYAVDDNSATVKDSVVQPELLTQTVDAYEVSSDVGVIDGNLIIAYYANAGFGRISQRTAGLGLVDGEVFNVRVKGSCTKQATVYVQASVTGGRVAQTVNGEFDIVLQWTATHSDMFVTLENQNNSDQTLVLDYVSTSARKNTDGTIENYVPANWTFENPDAPLGNELWINPILVDTATYVDGVLTIDAGITKQGAYVLTEDGPHLLSFNAEILDPRIAFSGQVNLVGTIGPQIENSGHYEMILESSGAIGIKRDTNTTSILANFTNISLRKLQKPFGNYINIDSSDVVSTQ